MSRRIVTWLLQLSFCACLPALAGSLPEYGMRGGNQARDLDFPTEVSDVEFETTPRLALYKPDGDGPFPGLVLAHQCGGLRNNDSMLYWAREAVTRGYAVLLLGGRDNETPPQECITDLTPQKDAGAPIEWHLYPDATHCWDCKQWDGFRKTDIRGSAVEYHYDEAVTKDSGRRMFEFIEKVFKESMASNR